MVESYAGTLDKLMFRLDETRSALSYTDADRDLLFNECNNSPHEDIIITHGTDTMLKTAERLSSIQNKRIILTGATKPERFKDSDAVFNIGMAIGSIPHLKPGVYIALHGNVMAWETVSRDETTGIFRIEREST